MVLYLIFEMILIVAYLYKNIYLGLIAWFVIMYWHKKNSISAIDFWVGLIISAIPISYLEFTCEIGTHILKWYNFAVIGLVLSLVRRKMVFQIKSLVVLFIALSVQFIRTMFSEDLIGALIELIQEYILIIPVFLLWNYMKYNKDGLGNEIGVEKWVQLLKNTAFMASLGVLFQYAVYTYTGKVIGYATIWATRQVFDLTFTGYSVLSVFLGIAMILAVRDILQKRNSFLNLLIFIAGAMACAINSSRSGFFAAIVVIAIMIFIAMGDSKKSVRVLTFGVPIAVLGFGALMFFISARGSVQDGNLLFANGRDHLMNEAFEIMGADLLTFFVGIGINGVTELGLRSQHNMLLEFWTLNGTPLFVVFLVTVTLILWKTRKVDSRYILWQVILSHQFFSSFFATTFTLPILCIVAGEYYLSKERKMENKER